MVVRRSPAAQIKRLHGATAEPFSKSLSSLGTNTARQPFFSYFFDLIPGKFSRQAFIDISPNLAAVADRS
jgi:hypothetical protein